ncbi:glycoside hydrolase family 32 protein [Herbiconiux liukaitaii]|uniref:glycoside hydrolase family 32 protein n=1 Tax=Herbiconiux liukaitaii TaxID=3342799 RepID=UPI0035B6C064
MTTDLRPRAHFTPARNWMNDPNGLVHHDGVYHLFFQHNPFGATWGNMSWGHATSRDLVIWDELPVAIPCAAEEEIYSGSVVVDHRNSSGLGSSDRPPLVAIYTGVSTDGRQAQSLAFSTDGGYRWEKFSDNPVLDRGSREFRDPKVFEFTSAAGGTRWIMVAVEAVDRQVLVYSSTDLRDWSFESVIGPTGPGDVVWECPDLFPLPVDGDPDRSKWVLLLSTNRTGDITDSSMSYLIGSFDGHAFVADEVSAWRALDHGRDFYAAVTFSDVPDERRIAIGWAGNWQYAAETPTHPWRGAMSSPRELSLTEQDGVVMLRQALPREWGMEGSTADDSQPWREVQIIPGERISLPAGRHYIADVSWTPSPDSTLSLELVAGLGTGVRLVYDAAEQLLSLDRRNSGGPEVHPGFATRTEAVTRLRDGALLLRIVVDASIVEVFADSGAITFTDLVFPPDDADGLVLAADGGTGTVTVRALPSAARTVGA